MRWLVAGALGCLIGGAESAALTLDDPDSDVSLFGSVLLFGVLPAVVVATLLAAFAPVAGGLCIALCIVVMLGSGGGFADEAWGVNAFTAFALSSLCCLLTAAYASRDRWGGPS